ncbi:MAG: hypothetical protein VW683_00405 [Betaproteobacteria bacterium]|jgi:hypothetical protein
MAYVHNNFIFVHVPKTGGTWFRKLMHRRGQEGEEFGWNKSGGVSPAYGYHCGLKTVPERHRNRSVLAFIRNPVDWYGSYFYYSLNKKQPYSNHIFDWASNKSSLDINGFIIKLLTSTESPHLQHTWQPRKILDEMRHHDVGFYTWWYLDMISKQSVTDIEDIPSLFDDIFCVKMENLNEDLSEFFTSVNMNIDLNLGPLNETKKPKLWKDTITDESLDLIKYKERYIIERFGYEIN